MQHNCKNLPRVVHIQFYDSDNVASDVKQHFNNKLKSAYLLTELISHVRKFAQKPLTARQ